LTPLFEGNLRTQRQEILPQKTNVTVVANSKDFVILGVAVLIQCQGVTDRQTNVQTMAKTREAFCCRA